MSINLCHHDLFMYTKVFIPSDDTQGVHKPLWPSGHCQTTTLLQPAPTHNPLFLPQTGIHAFRLHNIQYTPKCKGARRYMPSLGPRKILRVRDYIKVVVFTRFEYRFPYTSYSTVDQHHPPHPTTWKSRRATRPQTPLKGRLYSLQDSFIVKNTKQLTG